MLYEVNSFHGLSKSSLFSFSQGVYEHLVEVGSRLDADFNAAKLGFAHNDSTAFSSSGL